MQSPVNRMAKIDLSRAPSSMEMLADTWAGHGVSPARRRAPMTLREVMAVEAGRMDARAAERERGV